MKFLKLSIAFFILIFSYNIANANTIDTDLFKAATIGNKELVESLIQQGADVNAQNKEGATALMLAAGKGNKDIAELLIQHGANVNIRSNENVSALDLALYFKHYDIADLLQKHGAIE